MNRINHAILGLTALLLAQGAQAQHIPKKMYIKVAGGYFFSVSPGQFPDVGPYPPRDIRNNVNPASGAVTEVFEKVLTGSYGEGVRGGISIGYNFNKNVAIEGTFNYYHSKNNLMTRNVSVFEGLNKDAARIESDGHVNAIDFAPSLVLSPGYEKFNPYVRFGFVVPLWGRLFIETEAMRMSRPAGLPLPAGAMVRTDISRKEEIKPNPTIGFQGAMGFNYNVSRRIDVFAEAEYRNVPVRSKSKEVTEYNETNKVVNLQSGQELSQLPGRSIGDLSTAERETRYVTVLDEGSNTPTGTSGSKTIYKHDNAPANDLKSYINIGGLGLNAGVRIKF
ncbi:outer membrane beta-barrel protein [Chitinophaga rhizosphaerae]|uniref:outer membrane beta-barrel protein n=1 Tax=Chitinophaga rhizosphaerae TaxID=1864947 RepID=UPI000F808381|nr:outer membrane beta-barrel protein [Chitinophaga rhizosphaerae]